MKKMYFLMLFMFISWTAISQCFVYEGFDNGSMPPAGWSLDGLEAQWSVANSDLAGGTMPEGKFTYTSGTAMTRLISPVMDLTGMTSVKLSFSHFYDDYDGSGPKLGVATRSNNGAWTNVWEINPTSNVGPEQKVIEITGPDMGQSNFQFCFYLNGNMYNIDYWYVDNVLFYNPVQKNASITSIQTPKYFADPVSAYGTIMNLGTDPVTSVDMSWQIDGGLVHSTNMNGLDIPIEGIYEYNLSELINPPVGVHDLKVWIDMVNGSPDAFATDDTLSKEINKVCFTIPRMPVFEEFTSSTCGPCAQFNTGFVPWCNDHDADSTIALLKYQMDWPGAGDPYYTEEGGVRRFYYGVNAVPDLYCNGSNVATDMSNVQSAYDVALTMPGLVKISSVYTLENKILTIEASLLPFANFNDMLINIGVFEEITYDNVATNGETEFEHVMMKMVPDGNGTVTDLTDRTTFTINQTVDLTSTNIERWDDIHVIVFAQDLTGKEIYQSAYSKLDGMLGLDASLSNILVTGSGIGGFDPDVFEYDYEVPSGTVELPVVEGIPTDPDATVIVVPALEIPGTTTIDVFSEDLVSHNVYNVNFDWAAGSGDMKATAVNVYPNPTHGLVNITGATGAKVSVVDSKGQILFTQDHFSGSSVNLSSYSKGVYLVTVEVAGKTPVHNRVVLY